MNNRSFDFARSAGLIVVLTLWWLASLMGQSNVLPGPVAVLRSAAQLLVAGTLVEHAAISLQRVLVGFALGTAAGVTLGMTVGLSRLAKRTIYILVEVLRPVPGIAWLPLALLWFGLGEGPKYFLIAIGSFFPVFVGTLRGMQQTDPLHVRSAQALGSSRWQVVRDVIFPSALPEILTAQRVGLSLGFIYMVAAELIGSQSGLGYIITHARLSGLTDQIYVGILLVGALNLGLGTLQRAVERYVLRWHVGLGGSP